MPETQDPVTTEVTQAQAAGDPVRASDLARAAERKPNRRKTQKGGDRKPRKRGRK